jgi:hypothetical protein
MNYQHNRHQLPQPDLMVAAGPAFDFDTHQPVTPNSARHSHDHLLDDHRQADPHGHLGGMDVHFHPHLQSHGYGVGSLGVHPQGHMVMHMPPMPTHHHYDGQVSWKARCFG